MTYHHGDLPNALLDAVEALVIDQGIEQLSLRGVAKHAGVSHGAPAHHFKDKKGLLSAFARRSANTLEQHVLDALATVDEDDHAGRLTQVGMGYVEFAIRHPAQFQVCFRRELLDLSNGDLLEARTRAGKTLDDVLRHAVEMGALSNTDYPAIRIASWSLAHGYASLVVDQALPATDDKSLREIAFAAFSTYCRHIFRQ